MAQLRENSMVASAVLLTLIMLTASATSCMGAKDMSVTIYNHMRAPLTVHCKSGDTNLQQHTLVDRQQYGFAFKPNFWGTTFFWCDFRSGAKSLSIPVWQDAGFFNNQERWCEQCVWDVRPGGVYRAEAEEQLQPVHVW